MLLKVFRIYNAPGGYATHFLSAHIFFKSGNN